MMTTWEKFERAVFLLCLIVAACDVLWWRADNKDKVRAIKVNRDRRLATGKLSTNIVSKLMKLQRGCCACCGASLADGYHLDHIMPIAKGGQNSDDNVQLLTPTCNLKKKDLDPITWAQKNGRLL